jgi:hypothetical protein
VYYYYLPGGTVGYPAPPQIHSLRVGWRNLVRVSLIFAIIVSFMLFTVFPLVKNPPPAPGSLFLGVAIRSASGRDLS